MGRVKIKSGNSTTKLRSTKNKQVLKTKTKTDIGTRSAKVVSKKNEPVKKVVKTKKRKTYSKDISGRGAKIGAAVGGAVAGATAAKMMQGRPTTVYKSGKAASYRNVKDTIPIQRSSPSTGKKYVISGGSYSGTPKGDRALGAGFTAGGAAIGAAVGSNLQKKSKVTRSKTVRSKSKIVGGVDKTAAKQRVKSARQTIRAKKKSIRKR